jgi:amino acid transporter
MNASKSAAQVFQYLVSLVTIVAVLNWVAILVSYTSFKRALKAQSITPAMQPYVGYLQPYGALCPVHVSRRRHLQGMKNHVTAMHTLDSSSRL